MVIHLRLCWMFVVALGGKLHILLAFLLLSPIQMLGFPKDTSLHSVWSHSSFCYNSLLLYGGPVGVVLRLGKGRLIIRLNLSVQWASISGLWPSWVFLQWLFLQWYHFPPTPRLLFLSLILESSVYFLEALTPPECLLSPEVRQKGLKNQN